MENTTVDYDVLVPELGEDIQEETVDVREEDIRKRLEDYISDSIGGDNGDEISRQRIEALKKYYSQPLGNEKKGHSHFVSSECRDAVLWMLPSLLNVFLTAEKIAEFKPSTADAIEQAEQQTDYINYLVLQENDAFKLFTVWFFDALVTKTGFVKAYYDEEITLSPEEYTGLDEMMASKVMEDPAIEVLDKQETIVTDTQEGVDPQTGEPFVVDTPKIEYSLKVNRKNTKKKFVVENIAPEDVIVSSNATSIEDTKFLAIVYYKTKSELLAAGYDESQLEGLPTTESTDGTEESEVRNEVNSSIDSTLSSIQYYEILECYAYVDEDGDGIDELHKITVCDRESLIILDDEIVDTIPVAAITPFLKPYSLFGMSLVDNVKELQDVNTTLWRNCLDYLYTTVRPQWEVVDRNIVNKDDLTNRIPGGYVRTKNIGSISPIMNPPLQPEFFGFFDRLNAMRDTRTGVTPLNSGLDKNALKSNSATNNMEMSAAGRQLQDFIARSFAETGIRRLFRILQGLVIKHQDSPTVVRLRGRFVPVDPTTWSNPVDISVNVGLGTGTTQQKAAELQQIIALQMQVMPLGVANSANIYHALSKLSEISGYKDIQNWWTDPSIVPPAPPKPTKEEVDLEQLKANQELELKRLEIDAKRLELDKYKADLDAQIEMNKIAIDAAMKDKAIKEKVATAKSDRKVDFFPGVRDD